MRLIEFANAEEQLALWKLINDNVWSAIHAQAQEQAKQRAEQEYKKKKGKRASMLPSSAGGLIGISQQSGCCVRDFHVTLSAISSPEG